MKNTIENYTQQASQPEFYNSNDTSIFLSAVSGSSPFNEWYEFSDKMQAVDFMETTFSSQSFLDKFTPLAGRLYYSDELHTLLIDQFGEDHDYSEVVEKANLDTLKEADLSEAVWAESRF